MLAKRILWIKEFPKPVDAKEFIMPRYPHMSPQEADIFNRFLRTTKLKFLRAAYDIRVGPGHVPEWLVEPAIIKSVKAITQLRIDALLEAPDAFWIFEVKPRAGRSALGQLEAYGYWFMHDYAPMKTIRLACVAREVDTNMVRLFEAHAIEVFVV